MLHAVIMAGGSGTRFWPLSRRAVPKQFLRLTGQRSLIQMAFDRCQPWVSPENVWVVTNERLAQQTAEQLPAIDDRHILEEPCGRNTAPCVGLAALCLAAHDPDAVMLVMPADHAIDPPEQFQAAVERAAALVEANPETLVLFGVPPTFPSTGFGYIERSALIDAKAGAYNVASFREKPARDVAETYLRDGNFYWNCGIFVWRAQRILESLEQHVPDLHALLMRLKPHVDRPTWTEKLAKTFPEMPSISIDYAVLERESTIAVVEAPFAWDDVGSWLALERMQEADADGNTVVGPHCGIDTRRCIIRTSRKHLVATYGIEDCIIVHTADATLVARRDDENAVRQLVAALEERQDVQYL